LPKQIKNKQTREKKGRPKRYDGWELGKLQTLYSRGTSSQGGTTPSYQSGGKILESENRSEDKAKATRGAKKGTIKRKTERARN